MRSLARSIAIGVALLSGVSTAQADPPARVGRLSLVAGPVTLHDARTGESEAATLNWPVTSGAAITTGPGGRAEVRIGSSAIRLAAATDLEFVQIDDQAILLRLGQGTVSVRVRNREHAEQFALETPQARAQLLDAGRYRFDASPRAGTTVTAFQGAAQLAVGGAAVAVPAGKRVDVGLNREVESVEAFADGFDEWTLARDQRDDASRAARYVSPEMTGSESLDEYGQWRDAPDYGPVWVPREVPVGWAPYRSGRWAWVEPWGWTWIDDAPWGFAPFHYGRWALIGGAWAWVPGAFVARPVYAPALVGWIGNPGWSVTISIGAVPAVGWFPLAPREVFVPAYRCSTAYVRNVNVTHVMNVTVVDATRIRYAHRLVDRAVTVVPASAVSHGQPVARSIVGVRHADLAVAARASNAPPAIVAKPPRRSSDGGRARDDADWARRPRQAAAAAPRDVPQVSAPTVATPRWRTRDAGGPALEVRAAIRDPSVRPAERSMVAQPAPPVTAVAPPRVDARPADPGPRLEPPQRRGGDRARDGDRDRSGRDPRREVRRIEAPRVAAPATAAPAPVQPRTPNQPPALRAPAPGPQATAQQPMTQSRHEAPRPAPVMRSAPASAPVATPQPSTPQQSGPRSDNGYRPGREQQRRGDGR